MARRTERCIHLPRFWELEAPVSLGLRGGVAGHSTVRTGHWPFGEQLDRLEVAATVRTTPRAHFDHRTPSKSPNKSVHPPAHFLSVKTPPSTETRIGVK